jgi:hypothetical protein
MRRGLPLLSYLPGGSVAASVAATGAVLFAIGAIKSRWSLAARWKSGWKLC